MSKYFQTIQFHQYPSIEQIRSLMMERKPTNKSYIKSCSNLSTANRLVAGKISRILANFFKPN